jgi:hypothetical protein
MIGLWLRARILVADLIVDLATVAAWLGLRAVAASLCRGARSVLPKKYQWR